MTMQRGTKKRPGLDLVRAKHALEAAGLDSGLPLARASSVTNEVWIGDEFVVHVDRRQDGHLRREAQLGPHLPAEARYPEVVGHGTGTGFDWLVTRRSAGRVLARCWPTMSQSQQRHAVEQVAFMMRALHATTISGRLRHEHDADALQLLDFTHERSPVAPLLTALEIAARLPNVDPGVVSGLAALVETTGPTIEPFDVRTLIHGELTFENVLWDHDEVTALIGFEWARPAPHDLELDALLRFCAYSFLHVTDDYEAHIRAEPYEEVVSWLAADYPELFAAPNLRDRLRLYAIAFEVRRLLVRPPSAPMRELSARDPLSRLVQLLDRRSHLDLNDVNRVLPG